MPSALPVPALMFRIGTILPLELVVTVFAVPFGPMLFALPGLLFKLLFKLPLKLFFVLVDTLFDLLANLLLQDTVFESVSLGKEIGFNQLEP